VWARSELLPLLRTIPKLGRCRSPPTFYSRPHVRHTTLAPSPPANTAFTKPPDGAVAATPWPIAGFSWLSGGGQCTSVAVGGGLEADGRGSGRMVILMGLGSLCPPIGIRSPCVWPATSVSLVTNPPCAIVRLGGKKKKVSGGRRAGWRSALVHGGFRVLCGGGGRVHFVGGMEVEGLCRLRAERGGGGGRRGP